MGKMTDLGWLEDWKGRKKRGAEIGSVACRGAVQVGK